MISYKVTNSNLVFQEHHGLTYPIASASQSADLLIYVEQARQITLILGDQR